MKFDTSGFSVAKKVKQKLNGIREGKEADIYGWMFKV